MHATTALWESVLRGTNRHAQAERMTQSETVVIRREFQGPRGTGNGGYVAGIAAGCLDATAAEVTLRSPAPLDTALRIERKSEGGVTLWNDRILVCEARAAKPDLDPPKPPFDWTLAARLRQCGGGQVDSVYGHCIVCGRGRGVGDGLQVWADRVPDCDGRSMALYLPHINHADAGGRIWPEFIWGALDCPGAWAAQGPDAEQEARTGRLTAEIYRRPQAGERCLVVGWRIATDGRKLHAGTALYGEDGSLCAMARQLWIVLRS